MILKFACIPCSTHAEGTGDPPLFWVCSKPMYVWGVRHGG
jgi:hypothetical protein